MKYILRLTWLQWLLLGTFVLIVTGFLGLALGYASGVKEREKNLAISIVMDAQEQFDLGLKDFEAGNYDLARQRFEYVVQQDPDFPGVVDILTETLVQLSEPAIQITDTALSSPTSSHSGSVEDLFALTEELFRNQDWKNLVRTIVSLRDIDPLFRASEVDRMLFLGLRFSGIEKILNDGNLEGGVYDLALVERFAPLDHQTRIYQEWARLYQIGVSFWGIFPEKSVYYFSQLASAAPYLRDFSGIYAKDRYRMALLQYGDQLAQAGEWCLSVEQYNLAFSLLDDQGLQPTVTFAEEQCLSGGASPTTTQALEISGTPTMTLIPTLTVSPDTNLTPTVEVTLTPTPFEATPEPSPTGTESAIAPTPTPPETPIPTTETSP